jgi:hypothetical protein
MGRATRRLLRKPRTAVGICTPGLAGAKSFPYPNERRRAVQRRKELITSLVVDIE